MVIMDFLPDIDLSSAQGGLLEVLEKTGVPPAVVKWITSSEPDCLFIENMYDFVLVTTEAKFEFFWKDSLTKAKLESLALERDFNKAVARVRRAWKTASRAVGKTVEPPPPTVLTEAELEGPLSKQETTDLHDGWHKA